MAHGTPASLADMPEYLKVVRGGRPPSPELIEEMTHNYTAIGGRSPLTDITLAQGAALAQRLGPSIAVAVGMRNWHPYIKAAMDELAAKPVDRIIGLPLAPQFSTLSVQKYMDAARAALPADRTFTPVRSFHDNPLLLQAFAERVRAANPRPDETVVFTAHSLPKRVIDGGDVYADEVAATAKGVAALAGVERYDVAYQSAGRTPEPWIGPDLTEFVAARAADGQRAFLVVPIGFVCDHTEVLFDIDVQAARAAREAGATLRRTESLNTSPTFISALESIVRALL
jgi:protoporphyrin/coproporphyrin ferrochelatase